ncbi:hypothetical protein GH5_07272 [Leishmania sp. Ghana 2012 LV757]|uniref:hypothetical protein n=1 Tax=Leishmania sp. Ghana 2012 LV757 TaxID=2803181 RepID=UPI001B60D584|nr:hypothetical protein GH5_07272 [Leishmania sp. Ghana 2012 LV757]
MYSFSLASKCKRTTAESLESAPPPVTHVIRTPCELSSHQQLPQSLPRQSNGTNNGGDVVQVCNARFGLRPVHEHAPISSLYAADPPVEEPVRVHNLSSYMSLRDAADWSVEVQREREKKKQRALAQHEAVKLKEQRRRDAQEAQAKEEMQQHRFERQQERAALREADAIANFQDRNTQFLQNQLWLMQVGDHVTQAEAQRKAHARKKLYKSCSTRNQLGLGHAKMSSLAGANVSGHHISAPFTELDLRKAAQVTEEAYVRLSLAYRNEAQRSSAAAEILYPAELIGKRRSRPHATRLTGALEWPTSLSAPSKAAAAASTPSHSTATSPAPAEGTATVAVDSAPFRTAPPMFTHASTENMGQYANAIPYTYIPEYFDTPSATSIVGRAAPTRSTGQSQRQQHTSAVMPLPLSPAPVSRDVSGELQARYYPWALYSAAAIRESMLPPAPPPREASLPVHQWGAAELRDSMFGHCVLTDGSIQGQCERRKAWAAYLSYTTLPRDNATATSNDPVEPQVPLHVGKRMDIWL